MSPGVHAAVHRLGPEEWATLRDVRLAMLADSPESFVATLEEERGRDEGSWRDQVGARAWFVAERDGTVVGVACGGELRDPDPKERALRSMWVDGAARGSGVADALVDAVAAWARDEGASRLSLWALETATRAHRFYARYGFRATEEVREVHGRPHVAMTHYELDLAPNPDLDEGAPRAT